MKEQERRKALLDATAGIREMYIEEAAVPGRRTVPVWTRYVAAAAALAQLGDHRGRGHLEHQLKMEKDPQVKEALRQALGRIHGD